MLAIFHKQFAHPPQELISPESSSNIPSGKPGSARRQPKNPDEILRDFYAAHPVDSFSATFSGGAALACVGPHSRQPSIHQRLFCSIDDIYCMFVGSIHNLSTLIRQYGLCSKSTNEAVLVIEAYRTLRDRGPYPADQVVNDLSGSFSFVVYDNRSGAVFAALSSDGAMPLYWGIGADGSVVICDERDVVKGGCGKSYAPFPPGCMFHSEGGLKSFEHPMNKMKAMPRVDSEGVMCGANFKVDTCSKINSMPRVGSAANWAGWGDSV
ncbi:stem-specific protein TSJT1-like [Typha angustifolia]|uniref:stem-specific protein TSJT1-like n=1 Tax=Typha angustifolia TaxID=59011 RepID=UPI003C304DB2